MHGPRLDVDLHLLELRFASARLIEPQAVEKLDRSIERDGQIVPCVVVRGSPGSSDAKDGDRLMLIDGYRRVAALRRLGRDRASVERWPCDLAEAVMGVLARTQGRCLLPSKRRCCCASSRKGSGCHTARGRPPLRA
jgi:hypothetical protein